MTSCHILPERRGWVNMTTINHSLIFLTFLPASFLFFYISSNLLLFCLFSVTSTVILPPCFCSFLISRTHKQTSDALSIKVVHRKLTWSNRSDTNEEWIYFTVLSFACVKSRWVAKCLIIHRKKKKGRLLPPCWLSLWRRSNDT